MRMSLRSQVARDNYNDKIMVSDNSGTILINDQLFTSSEAEIPVVLTESSSEAAVSKSLQYTASPYKTAQNTGFVHGFHSDTDQQ